MRAMPLVTVVLVAAGSAQAINHLMADDPIGYFRVNDLANGQPYLTDWDGLTVYAYANDPPGKSTCADACAATWRAVLAVPADQALDPFSIIIRDDGQRQWAHEGRPLYRNLNDKKPGDTHGDGFDGVWHLVEVRAHFM